MTWMLYQFAAARDDQVGARPALGDQFGRQRRSLAQGARVVGATHRQGDHMVDAVLGIDHFRVELGEDDRQGKTVVANKGEFAYLSVGTPAALRRKPAS